MADRGILFKPELVRAILAGRKTVTRRLMKPQPEPRWNLRESEAGSASFCRGEHHRSSDCSDDVVIRCPQGKPGDRLYVKETWRPRKLHTCDGNVGVCDLCLVEVTYAADGATRTMRHPYDGDLPKAAARGNVSPLFMPRWASRLWLDVVSVRAERLQAITHEDARAEGVDNRSDLAWDEAVGVATLTGEDAFAAAVRLGYRAGFAHKWNEINGPDAWERNPWIWRIEFKEGGSR